jgi:hypothetical protein
VSERQVVSITLGPLPSEAVVAWVANSARLLDLLPSESAPGLPIETASDMHDLLREWHVKALTEPVFEWRRQIDPAQLALLVGHWHRLACRVADEAQRGNLPIADPVARPFYEALVAAALDGLEGAGGAHAELARELRVSWPR